MVVAVVCALATVSATRSPTSAGGNFRAAIDGFAAGALLVMLVDTMIPEAQEKRDSPGSRVLGFAVAAGLSGLS